MSRTPTDAPSAIGDRVALRGRGFQGTLRTLDTERLWVQVDWDDKNGPKVVHLYELKKVLP